MTFDLGSSNEAPRAISIEPLLRDEVELLSSGSRLDERGDAKPKSDGLGLVGKVESLLFGLLLTHLSDFGGASSVCVTSVIVMTGSSCSPPSLVVSDSEASDWESESVL